MDRNPEWFWHMFAKCEAKAARYCRAGRARSSGVRRCGLHRDICQEPTEADDRRARRARESLKSKLSPSRWYVGRRYLPLFDGRDSQPCPWGNSVIVMAMVGSRSHKKRVKELASPIYVERAYNAAAQLVHLFDCDEPSRRLRHHGRLHVGRQTKRFRARPDFRRCRSVNARPLTASGCM